MTCALTGYGFRASGLELDALHIGGRDADISAVLPDLRRLLGVQVMEYLAILKDLEALDLRISLAQMKPET